MKKILYLLSVLIYTGFIKAQTTCTGAIPITVTDTTVSVNAYSGSEYWAAFTAAPYPGQRISVTQNSATRFKYLEVYEGTSCTNLSLVAIDSINSADLRLEILTGNLNTSLLHFIHFSNPQSPTSVIQPIDIVYDIDLLRGAWIELLDALGNPIQYCGQSANPGTDALIISCVVNICPGDTLHLVPVVTEGISSFNCTSMNVTWSAAPFQIVGGTNFFPNVPFTVPATGSTGVIPSWNGTPIDIVVPSNITSGTFPVWFSASQNCSSLGSSPAPADTSLMLMVTVNPPPSLTFTVSPNPTCGLVTINSTITNQPPGAAYFFYNYGDGTASTNSNSHTYQNAGVFVVTHTVSVDYCTATASQTVTVQNTWSMQNTTDCLNPTKNSFTFLNPCFPNQTDITVNWGDGTSDFYNLYINGQQAVTHTFPNAGTYTVTLTDLNSPPSQTFTVIVSPAISAPIIQTTAFTECSGTAANYLAQSPQAGVTYTWELSQTIGFFSTVVQSGTGNLFTVNWPAIVQQGAAYTLCLIASTPNGCQKTTCLKIIDCCNNPSVTKPEFIFDNCTLVPFGSGSVNYANVAAIPNGVPIVNQTIGINTNLIVGANITVLNNLTVNSGGQFTFQSCNMMMNPYSKITAISNLRIYECYMHGCNGMWAGMIAQNGTVLVQYSMIEDAVIAIDKRPNGIYKIEQSIFNKNDQSLFASGNVNNSKLLLSYVKNTLFTCRALPATLYPTAGGTLGTFVASATNWAIYPQAGLLGNNTIPAGIRSRNGIVLQNNATPPFGMSIGDNSLTNGGNNALTNVFENLNTGIAISRTKVNIVNNYFANIIHRGTNLAVSAIAVAGNLPSFGNIPANVTVGGNTIAERNIFVNDTIGVQGNVCANLTVRRDSFNLNRVGVLIRNWQFGTQTNYLATVIQSNFFNCKQGVACSNNTNINCQIINNTFRNTLLNAQATAINLIEFTPTNTGAKYTVTGNDPIRGMNIGAFCLNINGARINQNRFVTRPSTSSLIPVASVYMANCIGMNVFSNDISHFPNSSATSFNYGVFATLSPSSNIYCNEFANIGHSVHCEGVMPSHIYANNFISGGNAVYLNNACDIGPQDNPNFPATQQPQDNIFNTTGYSGTNYVSDQFSAAHTVYFRNNSTTPPIGYSWTPTQSFIGGGLAFSLSPVSPTSTPPVSSSPATANCTPPPVFALFNNANAIAQGTQNFGSLTSQAQFMNRRNLFHNIRIGGINVSNDAVLNPFMANSTSGNYGKFYTVDSTLKAGISFADSLQLQNAKAANLNVSTSNNIEGNQQTVNDIYIAYSITGSLNAADYNTLQSIAWLCPFTEGTAVFQARAVLNMVDTLHYENACELPAIEANARLQQNQEAKVYLATDVKVYPNPAKNSVNLSYEGAETDEVVFELFNVLGEKVATEKVIYNPERMTISISSVSDGTYLYRVTVNREVKASGRIAIVK